MGFEELIAVLARGDDQSRAEIRESIADFMDFLKAQEEIRVYVDNTPNFGHQATTIFLLKRLIDFSGYAHKITIFYFPTDTSTGHKSIPARLALMLAGLDPRGTAPDYIDGETVGYGTCLAPNISFCQFDRRRERTGSEVLFGFTGGADDMGANYATELNVGYFLRLQPYLWTSPSRIERKGVEGHIAIDDSAMPYSFKKLAFMYDVGKVNPVPDDVWTWYSTADCLESSLKGRVLKARAIIAKVGMGDASPRLWPVYGLHQFNPREVLLTLALSALTFQSQKGAATEQQRPIVIVLINDFTEDTYGGCVDLLEAFKKGKAAIAELMVNTFSFVSYDPQNPEIPTSLGNIVSCLQERRDSLLGANADRIQILPLNSGKAEIEKALGALKAEQILIAPLGSLPQDIYNLMYARTEMPGFFEGQGTSSLAINLGKPFFQTSKSDTGIACNYPDLAELTSGAVFKGMSALVRSINEASQKTVESFYTVVIPKSKREKNYYKQSIDSIAACIAAGYRPDTPSHNYFKDVSVFFQNPIRDKFMLGLVLVNSFLPPRQKTFLGGDAALTLETVYDSLVAHLKDGVLDLVAALPNTHLAAFLSLITGSGFSVGTRPECITKEGSEGALTRVAISAGTVSFLGTEYALTMDFRYAEGTRWVVSSLSTASAETWELPLVPWIGFESPGFSLELSEADLPASGRLTGRLRGTTLDIGIGYPVVDGTWVVSGSFEKPQTVLDAFYQLSGGINFVAALPAPLNGLGGFGLKSLEFAYKAETSTMSSMRFSIETDSDWVFFDKPRFSLKPRVDVVVYEPQNLSRRRVEFAIAGSFSIGKGLVRVLARYPDFRLEADLIENSIDLGELVALFGASVDLRSEISRFNLFLHPSTRDFSLSAEVVADWPLPSRDPVFTITGLGFEVSGSQDSYAVHFSGSTVILPDSAKIGIGVSASYATGKGWTFLGSQSSGIFFLGELLKQYTGWDVGQDLGIDGLTLRIETGGGTFEFGAKTAAPWSIDPLGLSVTGKVKVGYRGGAPGSIASTFRELGPGMPTLFDSASGRRVLGVTEEPKAGPYGEVGATIQWNNIEIGVSYDYAPDRRKFGVTWGIFSGDIGTEQVEGKEHNVAHMKFTQGTTLGSMIATMVAWATGSKFSLGSPWNILDRIPLSAFSLDWDFTDDTVKFNVDIGPVDFGFVTVKRISLAYDKDPDDKDRKRVMVDLDASFIWGDKIPRWDATKPETTPAPEGSGSKYFDLRLLALGQHLTFPGFRTADTVQKAMDSMATMPEPTGDAIPAVQFDANNSWLVGADFRVLRASEKGSKGGSSGNAAEYLLTLQTVFNDPSLYALRIALASDAAKIFKGLDFQIMYRKLNDQLGVYKGELTLPDLMRHLSVGAYSITLPVFGVEIYTNGDFKVDIGFPWNENFARSFSVEAIVPPGIPLVGSGGFYFGKLPEAAAENLPATTTGQFGPIIVFGFGAQVGLGKSLEYGILKAGFSLTVFGILQGLLAKWNPYDGQSTGTEPASQIQGQYYFRLEGSFGIIGKIYGSVDFAVVKAEVNITVKLFAQITFASYQPIPLSVVASVEATASLTINCGLFKIHLHFSFSIRIKETFTIGPLQNPADAPWLDRAATSASGLLMAPLSSRLHGARPRSAALALRPDWSKLLAPETPAALSGYLTFALTVAGDRAFDLPGSPDLSKQIPAAICGLFLGSVPAARDGDRRSALKASGAVADSSFEVLAKLLARWALASIQTQAVRPDQADELIVSDDELLGLLGYLDGEDGSASSRYPLPIEDIEDFLKDQLRCTFSLPTGEGEEDVVFFPLSPDLVLDCPAAGGYPALHYRFGDYNEMDEDFLDWLSEYFRQLAVQVQEETEAPKLRSGEGGTPRSMSAFVFTDYFLLIMRQMLESLRDGLRSFKRPLEKGESGNAIVEWVNATGHLEELPVRFSLDDLFAANGDHRLCSGRKLSVGGKDYRTGEGDTLNSIVAASGSTMADLASKANGEVVDLFDATDDDCLDLVHLCRFKLGELIREAQRSKALEHLSCMVSRYYLHGMRLPTIHLAPKKLGMWVSDAGGGKLRLPEAAGLFALTGQELPLPVLGAESFPISLDRSGAPVWLQFEGGAQRLTYTLDADSDDYKRALALKEYAVRQVLATDILSIGPRSAIETTASTFALSAPIAWSSASAPIFPRGGSVPGGGRTLLWQLPEALCALPRLDADEKDPCPRFALETERFDEASATTKSDPLGHYGWATSVEFGVKRLGAGPSTGAVATSYEITGAGERACALLERILRWGREDLFSCVSLGYTASSASGDRSFRAEFGPGLSLGISQANLSTDTRPPTSLGAPAKSERAEAGTALLNSPLEFCRLLWEACITRSGGFYLYYHLDSSAEEGGGLPAAIFNESGEAVLTLVLLYADTIPDRLHPAMNALVTGDALDLSSSVLVAKAASVAVKHEVAKGESLRIIADRYYGTLLSLARSNPEMRLALGAAYLVPNGTYVVSPDGKAPGALLVDIARYFATEPDLIKAANPRVSPAAWTEGLAANAAIRLPPLTRTVGTHPGGDSVRSVAEFYGTSPAAIVGANADDPAFLAEGQNLELSTGPFMESFPASAGIEILGASRKPLPDLPSGYTDPDYARDYLLGLYSLLGYRVLANQDFTASNMGLPLGPRGEQSAGTRDKIRAPKAMGELESMEYEKSLPYASLIVGASDGSADDPYLAVGRLLQIEYGWNDLYGNRLVTDVDGGLLPAGGPTKAPLLTGYADDLVPLSRWPAVSSSWTVAACPEHPDRFLLEVLLAFDPSPYNKGADGSDAWQTRARAAALVYRAVLDQLGDPNGVGLSFHAGLVTEPLDLAPDQIGDASSGLVGWLSELQRFMRDRAKGESSTPNPSRLSFTLSAAAQRSRLNPNQISRLDFTLVLKRKGGLAQGDFAAIAEVQAVSTAIAPMSVSASEGTEKGSRDLTAFARAIDAILSVKGSCRLAVGIGEDRRKTGPAEDSVWAVRLGEDGTIPLSYRIDEYDGKTGRGSPQIFAPRPPSNHLETRGNTSLHAYARLEDFDPRTNALVGATATLRFNDIDLDLWLKRLFLSMDTLMSPKFLSAMLIVDKKTTMHPSKVLSFADEFRNRKKNLASAARELMSPVFADQEVSRLDSAKNALYQALLGRLSNLYSVRAAVSYGAAVRAEAGLECPRLFGNVTWNPGVGVEGGGQVVLDSTKLNLRAGDAEALTFIVETPSLLNSEEHGVLPSLHLDLRYAGEAIEHQISRIPGMSDDYEASSWIRFVLPPDDLGKSLGRFEIPLFVRSFPGTPMLENQLGRAAGEALDGLGKRMEVGKDFRELCRWSYGFGYSLDFHYPQDRLYARVEYNVRDRMSRVVHADDAFEPLAQFITAQPQLERLLEQHLQGITAESGQDAIDQAAQVLGAYLKMVSDIVARSDEGGFCFDRTSSLKNGGSDDSRYAFSVEERERSFVLPDASRTITAWVVSIVSEGNIPPAGLSSDPSVDIAAEGLDRHQIPEGCVTRDEEGRELPLADRSRGLYSYWYSRNAVPLDGAEAQSIKGRWVLLPGMSILARQDAKSTVLLKRNEELVEGRPSNEAFVYQTPEVSFVNPLHASIDTSATVNIAAIPSAPPQRRALRDQLGELFAALSQDSPGRGMTVQLEVLYSYALNGALPSVTLPVLLVPPTLLPPEGGGGRSALLDDMAAAIKGWYSSNSPAREDGRFLFDLTVMSDLTAQPMPLLRLRSLYLALTNIADL